MPVPLQPGPGGRAVGPEDAAGCASDGGAPGRPGALTVQSGPGRPPGGGSLSMGGTVSMLRHGAAPIFKLPAPPAHEPPAHTSG